jgi:hypothetical protein
LSVRPDMSKWEDEKAERNRRALARLSKCLPTIFPPNVLAQALAARSRAQRLELAAW